MTPRLRAAIAAGVLGAGLGFGGCGSTWRPPIFLAQDFSDGRIAPIAILPPVDARIDTSIEVELDEQLRGDAVKVLERRGYPAVLSAAGADAGTVTLDELASADAARIRALGPPGARWVMILGLVDVSTALTFGSTGNAEVAGFLFDTERGVLLWRDKGVAQVGQGGLLGMALVGAMDEAAIQTAVGHLLASLPIQAVPPTPAAGAPPR